MEENLLKEGFHFEEYLDEKLMDISDLEHRKELKEVTKKVMLPLYEYVEKSYNQQVEQLKEEKAVEKDYTVWIGLEEKKKVDLSNEDMWPILPTDMDEVILDSYALRQALIKKTPYFMYSIFIKLDHKQIMEIVHSGRVFHGSIITQDGTYPASFQLRECKKYQEKVQELYPIFVRNMVRWKTVNMAYLHKFLDVVLIAAEFSEDEAIIEVKIDFEEYESAVRYQMVPLWNIRNLVVRDSGYPELCLDHIHYKHVIFQHKLKEGKTYLIDNPTVNIWNIYYENNDIVITCDNEMDISWNLLEFHKMEDRKKEYPYLGNKDKAQTVHPIHTKAEIYKFIKNLDYEKYLILKDIFVREKAMECKQSYDMNGELLEELRHYKSHMKLELEFVENNSETYINTDILSYLISRLQWEFPEYECSGHLVGGGCFHE